jgi:hypothetical protein
MPMIDTMRPRSFFVLVLLLLVAGSLTSAHAQSDETSQTASDSPGSWKMVGVVSGTGGLMFLAGALAYQSGASRDQDAVDQALDSGLPLDLERQERSDERAHTAVILGAVGASAILGGALAYYIGHRDAARSDTRVRVRPVVQSPQRQSSYTGLSLSLGF